MEPFHGSVALSGICAISWEHYATAARHHDWNRGSVSRLFWEHRPFFASSVGLNFELLRRPRAVWTGEFAI
jgi:hypothetical protein